MTDQQNPLSADLDLRKHPLLERGEIRQIGIHGARGSGKTCYLAALYGQRLNKDLGFNVSFNEDNPDDSLDHLDNAWRALSQGKVPPATALVSPFRLSLTATYAGQSWRLRTQDYAGVLVQRTQAGTPELKKEVQDWLCECDALLIFVDLMEKSDELLERLNEVDMLLSRLRKLSPDGQVVPIPVAILFTKWDRVAGNLQGAVFQEQQEKLRYFLAHRPEYKNFYDQVLASGDRVEVFPVSAFGASGEKNTPPPNGACPFGIHQPLLWALQQCDQAIFDAVEREASPLLHRRWAQYGKAIALYKTHAKKRLITRGPIAALLKQRISQLRLRAFSRFVAVAVTLGSALLAATATSLWAWDSYQYRRVLAILEDPTVDRKVKFRIATEYCESKNPFTGWLGRRAHIDSIVRDLQEKWHNADYAGLLDFYLKHQDLEEKQWELTKRCQEFLEHWPDSRHRTEVENLLQQAQARLRIAQERTDWASIVDFRTKNLGDDVSEERLKMLERFLQEYPNSQNREQAQLFLNDDKIALKRWQEFSKLRERCTSLDQKRQELAEKGGNFADALTQCERFQLDMDAFRNVCPPDVYERDYAPRISDLVKQLNDIQQRLESAWDDHEWRQVKNYATTNPEAYDEIINKARTYKDRSTLPRKKHIIEAERLITKTEIEWDRKEYEKFRAAAQQAASRRQIENFEAAARQADQYLQGPHPIKKHRASVAKWLAWLDGLRNGQTLLQVTITGATIGQRGVTITDPFDPPDVTVGLSIVTKAGNQQFRTEVRDNTFTPIYNEECSNIKVAWNDRNARITITLVDVDTAFHDVLSETFTGPDAIFLLDETIAIRDGNDTHHVNLRCAQLRPPSLPQYNDAQ